MIIPLGYAPLGAVAMQPKISGFFNERVYQGGLTFNSHPISLAAAIANIQVLQDDNLINHSAKMGKVLHKLLIDLGEKHPSIGDVRSIGLFGIIELVKNRTTKEPMAAFDSTSKEMKKIKNYLLDNGLFLYTHWHTLLIIPPLIINEEQLEDGFSILDEGLTIVDNAVMK